MNDAISKDLSVTPITLLELERVMLHWAAEEGWSYSRQDVETYFSIKGNTIYALKHVNGGANEELIGCLLAQQYTGPTGKILASLGLFIVKKEHRGKKYAGRFLWENMAKFLNTAEICCLNAVSRSMPYYASTGYFDTGAGNLHMQLTIPSAPNGAQAVNAAIEPIKPQLLSHIANYELKLFGMVPPERVEFINQWALRPDAFSIAYMNDGKVEGYAVVTIASNYRSEDRATKLRISPLYADSIDVAGLLLSEVLSHIVTPERTFFLDTPTINFARIGGMLEDIGFKVVTEGSTQIMLKTADRSGSLAMCPQVVAVTPLEFPHELVLGNFSSLR